MNPAPQLSEGYCPLTVAQQDQASGQYGDHPVVPQGDGGEDAALDVRPVGRRQLNLPIREGEAQVVDRAVGVEPDDPDVRRLVQATQRDRATRVPAAGDRLPGGAEPVTTSPSRS